MRWISSLAVLCACVLAGCEGDAGSAGPPGPVGAPGPAGPAPDVSAGGVPVESAERIDVSISGVEVPAGGGAPVVSLRLSNALNQGLTGLPPANIRFMIAQLEEGTAGGSSAWRSYVTRADGGVPDVQATTETATAGLFTDAGDGTYQYTFSKALVDYPAGPDFNASRTHRVGVEIRTNSGGFLPANLPANNAPYDFVPAGGEPVVTRLIVDNDTCNACHDNLELHGEARFDVEYCVQCHNPYSRDGGTGNSVDMKVMIHKIHHGVNLQNGYSVEGFGGRLHDYSHVVFPQDVRNCATCHDESDPGTPQAANWRLVANRAACGTCHDGIDWESPTAGHPGGLVFSDDSQCLDCHGPEATVNGGAVQIAAAHALPAQLAAAEFLYDIVDVTGVAAGAQPSVTYRVTNPVDDGAAYDLLASPAFTACADGNSRLTINIGWDSAEYSNVGNAAGDPLPIGFNALPNTACGGTAVVNGDGTYTVLSPDPLPAGLTGSIGVALEGYAWKDLNGDGSSSRAERIAVTTAVSYAGVGAGTAEARRVPVAISKCQDCHKHLTMHGNNRTDKPESCVMCHNPNATDDRQRGGGSCLSELGPDGESIDFKYMIHALHAGSVTGYSVCGFRNSVHDYGDLEYPGRLNNCEGCHTAGTYYPVDPAVVHGTTIAAGALDDPTDDTVISPTTAACYGCHVSPLAVEHMKQNGGDFEAGKTAASTLVSPEVETCALCHGPGRSADVRTVHGVDEFRFN